MNSAGTVNSEIAALGVFVLCIAILIPLAILGYHQSKRARAVSDDEIGSSFLAGVAFLFAFLASPLGILFAHLALRQIIRTGVAGARLATAALWVAYALTLLQLVALLWGSLTGYFR
ncbi:hypothetical protein GCM10009563_25940 [Subtercola frigoramans]